MILGFLAIGRVLLWGADEFERSTASMSSFETFLYFGLWIGLSLFFAVSTVIGFAGSVFAARSEDKRIIADGVAASAVITSITDTKTRINQSPVLEIGLLVTESDGGTFDTNVVLPVSIVDIGSFQIGLRVLVRFDPSTKETALAA